MDSQNSPEAAAHVDMLGNVLHVGDKVATAEVTTEFPYDVPVIVFGTINEVDPSQLTVLIDQGNGTRYGEDPKRVVRVVSTPEHAG